MHRTHDYQEGLHVSRFVGSNYAYTNYEIWCELPDELKSDIRITAWKLYNIFKSTFDAEHFTSDGESSVFNLYDIGYKYLGWGKGHKSGLVYRFLWEICQQIAKIVFPSWEYEDIVTPGGVIPVDYLDQPRVEFFGHPFCKKNGRYADAEEYKIIFPNPQSFSIFMGRLLALSHKRRNLKDGYKEFPIYPLARIKYRSRYYLALWPVTNINSSARSGCRRQVRRVFRQTKRVDADDRK